jgi:hypothetical protein
LPVSCAKACIEHASASEMIEKLRIVISDARPHDAHLPVRSIRSRERCCRWKRDSISTGTCWPLQGMTGAN